MSKGKSIITRTQYSKGLARPTSYFSIYTGEEIEDKTPRQIFLVFWHCFAVSSKNTEMDVLYHEHGYGGGTFEALNGRIYGNGTETLVLAHGYGADQSVWYHLIPYLACYFKVVVFDLVFSANVSPGLYNPKKYSSFKGYASDMVNLLDELRVNETIFVGHSMSAMIGCIASIKRPELFRHLVLLGGSPRCLLFSLELYVLPSTTIFCSS